MRGFPNLGRIFGVSIRLHYTWALAFALITAIMVTQFPEAYPLWQRVSFGIATSLLFFISVSIREFIISLTALSRGIPVKSITLFVFGGVSHTSKEATSPALELLVAATGLLTSLVIAGVFYGIYALLANTGSIVIAGLIQWLAFIYFFLFLFHFIPGFPLGGGRILRALLWKVTGDYEWATRIASWTGWGIGLLCIAGGILLLIFGRQWFNGLVLAGVGLVLQTAATQSRRQAALREALKKIKAQDIMAKEYSPITPQSTISQLIHDYILVTGQHYFVVADGDKLQGAVTMRDIKRVPKRRRGSHIGKIMIPASELKTAHPQQPAASLLDQMDELGIDHMPVLEEDKVIGIVSRDSLIRLAQTRAELRM
ncbi:MAG: site-2 protease family protein [Dehalococcoidales bacterium]|nr:site-2 protease family protein [Dehalococcoidales bacterium]